MLSNEQGVNTELEVLVLREERVEESDRVGGKLTNQRGGLTPTV